MLEDDYTYVIRKAFKGLALSPGEAALRAGLREKEVVAFSKGAFSETIARQLAPTLGLGPAALARHPHYLPCALKVPEITRIDLPFCGERVNAWLIATADSAILFDTGNDRDSCAIVFDSLLQRTLDLVLITHAHPDHIGGLQTFLERGVCLRGAENIAGAFPIRPGEEIQCGSLTVRACDLSGHATPALGYHVDGLSHPVLVTGDALFAGSIGGCATPEIYQHALSRLRQVLGPLPDDTVLLPGHGPGTTLGEERLSNPFLA